MLKQTIRALILYGTTVLVLCSSGFAQTDLPVITGCQLGSGLSIGLNTSDGKTDWITCENNTNFKMQYPGSPSQWGAVFVTNGPTLPPGSRSGRDMSGYQALLVEMSGDAGTSIELGIKDAGQGDDGSET